MNEYYFILNILLLLRKTYCLPLKSLLNNHWWNIGDKSIVKLSICFLQIATKRMVDRNFCVSHRVVNGIAKFTYREQCFHVEIYQNVVFTCLKNISIHWSKINAFSHQVLYFTRYENRRVWLKAQQHLFNIIILVWFRSYKIY